MKRERIDFFFDLFEKGKIPDFYSRVSYLNNSETVFESTKYAKESTDQNIIYTVKSIPDYMSVKPHDNLGLGLKKVSQYEQGCAILLDEINNLDAYLSSKSKSNAKATKRSIHRLEQCFDPEYTMFHGYISRQDYDSLMDSLQSMLIKRFEQLGEKNKRLEEWNRFYDRLFTLINTDRASIFVIYINKKPISITLNYHYHKLFFSAISSYDIDYSKFGLGHIEIFKQLEWCLAHKYKVFEMGLGAYEYKQRWSNLVYDFDFHFIYDKKSLPVVIFVQLKKLKVELNEFLISKNVFKYLETLKNIVKIKKVTANSYVLNKIQFTTENVDDLTISDRFLNIDIQSSNYDFLKKPIYDFLYTYCEHISDIKVYEITKQESYIVQGKGKIQKINIQSQKYARKFPYGTKLTPFVTKKQN